MQLMPRNIRQQHLFSIDVTVPEDFICSENAISTK